MPRPWAPAQGLEGDEALGLHQHQPAQAMRGPVVSRVRRCALSSCLRAPLDGHLYFKASATHTRSAGLRLACIDGRTAVGDVL